MSSNQGQIAAQFAAQLPLYLVYLACILLALVFWSRARLACLLALGAALWLLACSIAVTAVRFWCIRQVEASAWVPDDLARAMSTLAAVGSTAQAVGLGLLVTAVFVGRKARTPPAT